MKSSQPPRPAGVSGTFSNDSIQPSLKSASQQEVVSVQSQDEPVVANSFKQPFRKNNGYVFEIPSIIPVDLNEFEPVEHDRSLLLRPYRGGDHCVFESSNRLFQSFVLATARTPSYIL